MSTPIGVGTGILLWKYHILAVIRGKGLRLAEGSRLTAASNEDYILTPDGKYSSAVDTALGNDLFELKST